MLDVKILESERKRKEMKRKQNIEKNKNFSDQLFPSEISLIF